MHFSDLLNILAISCGSKSQFCNKLPNISPFLQPFAVHFSNQIKHSHSLLLSNNLDFFVPTSLRLFCLSLYWSVSTTFISIPFRSQVHLYTRAFPSSSAGVSLALDAQNALPSWASLLLIHQYCRCGMNYFEVWAK